MTLNVDFDNRSVEGMFDNFSGTDLAVILQNGAISNTRISADLVGQTGTDADGFKGSMDGQFYGPEAAEVGGTIEGTQDTAVFQGFFAGQKL